MKRRNVGAGRGALGVGLCWSGAVSGAPSAKTANWVNYWDNPRNVDQAINVVVALGCVALVVFALAWWTTSREKKRRDAARKGLAAASRRPSAALSSRAPSRVTPGVASRSASRAPRRT